MQPAARNDINGTPTTYRGDIVPVLDRNFQVAWAWGWPLRLSRGEQVEQRRRAFAVFLDQLKTRPGAATHDGEP